MTLLPVVQDGRCWAERIPMDADVNKALIWRLVDEAWNGANLAVLDDLTANPAAYRTAITDLRIAYPDLHISIDQLITEGDWVAYRWTARGTHELGVQLTWRGVTFSRIVQGKLVEDSSVADRLTLLEQLGVVPAQLVPQHQLASAAT